MTGFIHSENSKDEKEWIQKNNPKSPLSANKQTDIYTSQKFIARFTINISLCKYHHGPDQGIWQIKLHS